jgi:hypothetical protein
MLHQCVDVCVVRYLLLTEIQDTGKTQPSDSGDFGEDPRAKPNLIIP